jgi:hypothetical protein
MICAGLFAHASIIPSDHAAAVTALSVRGVEIAAYGRVEWNRGTRFAIYRCTLCAGEQYEGWPRRYTIRPERDLLSAT